jgi:hypothetical protein
LVWRVQYWNFLRISPDSLCITMLSTICINQLVGGYHKLCNLICWATRWHSYTVRNQWPQNRSLRYCVNKTYFQNSWGHSNVPWLVWMLSKVLGFLEIKQINFSPLAFKILIMPENFVVCKFELWSLLLLISLEIECFYSRWTQKCFRNIFEVPLLI